MGHTRCADVDAAPSCDARVFESFQKVSVKLFSLRRAVDVLAFL